MPGAMSEMRIAVAQCCHPADGDVEALVRSYARRAAEVGAQLLVFPEFLMTPFQVGPEEMARQAQGLQGPFSQMVRSVAAEFGLSGLTARMKARLSTPLGPANRGLLAPPKPAKAELPVPPRSVASPLTPRCSAMTRGRFAVSIARPTSSTRGHTPSLTLCRQVTSCAR